MLHLLREGRCAEDPLAGCAEFVCLLREGVLSEHPVGCGGLELLHGLLKSHDRVYPVYAYLVIELLVLGFGFVTLVGESDVLALLLELLSPP